MPVTNISRDIIAAAKGFIITAVII